MRRHVVISLGRVHSDLRIRELVHLLVVAHRLESVTVDHQFIGERVPQNNQIAQVQL